MNSKVSFTKDKEILKPLVERLLALSQGSSELEKKKLWHISYKATSDEIQNIKNWEIALRDLIAQSP